MLSILHDVRFAVRSLLKAPAITVVVVLTLAVAIGANTAIFSVVESVLLKPLPYPDEDRIVRVAATVKAQAGERGDRGNAFSDRGYWLFANNNHSFAKFGAYGGPLSVPLTGEGDARLISAAVMTLSAFEALGVRPELGRFPTAEEDSPGGAAVALLSHDLWVSQYAADPAIVGRVIAIDGAPREVIGVMPAYYGFPTPDIDMWVPFRLDPTSDNFGATVTTRLLVSPRASRLKLRQPTHAASSPVSVKSATAHFGSKASSTAVRWFARGATSSPAMRASRC